MSKTRLNISLDQDLADFIKVYVRENRTTVANVVTQLILALKRQTQGDIDRHINNFTALSVVGVLQYAFLPLAL